MAEFKLYGRFIAMSEEKQVASSTAGKEPIKKREVYMDCTRRDYFTGQQIGNENKVVLEFGGEKTLEKMKALNLQKDDIVVVDFSIVGAPYKDKETGRSKVFTSIRCYDINVHQRAGQAPQPVQQQAPAPAPQTQVQQAKQQSVQNESYDNVTEKDPLPF